MYAKTTGSQQIIFGCFQQLRGAFASGHSVAATASRTFSPVRGAIMPCLLCMNIAVILVLVGNRQPMETAYCRIQQSRVMRSMWGVCSSSLTPFMTTSTEGEYEIVIRGLQDTGPAESCCSRNLLAPGQRFRARGQRSEVRGQRPVGVASSRCTNLTGCAVLYENMYSIHRTHL